MKDYGIVLKMLVKNMFKRSSEKRNMKIFTGIVLGIAYILIMFSLITTVIELAPAMVETGLSAEILTAFFGIAVLVMLFFGIPIMLSTLYFSRDSEFFLALPVRSSTVYFAKISIVYLSMLSVEAVLLLPTVIVLGAMTGMGAQFYIVGLLAVLLLPAFPLMLSSIIAMPLMFAVGAFRNRGALSSVAMIILFVVFFGGYYALIYFVGFNTGSMEPGQEITMADILMRNSAALKLMANILLPFSSAARLATLSPVFGFEGTAAALINAGLYLGITTALVAIALGISSAFYRRSVMAMLESTRSKDNKKHEYKTSGGVVKALVKKEWRQLIRTPQFALNCLMSVFMPPIIMIFMNLSMRGAFVEMDSEEIEVIKIMLCGFNLLLIMMICVGLNMGAMTCITREGEAFAFSKSLPVSAHTQINAKRILYLAMSYASVAIGLIIALVFARDWIILGALLLIVPYNYIFVTLAIYLDLNSPKLKWTTPQEAMKRNTKGLIPFLINMVVCVIVFVAVIVSRVFLALAPEEYIFTFTLIHFAVWIFFIGIAAVVAVLMHNMLKVRAELYNNIEI